MTFAEKLDTIMNITNATNSGLSMQISIDASLVSRFRHGKRTPPKKAKYMLKMASYFSQRITTDYQKSALCEIINIDSKDFPTDQKKISELIYQWLTEENITYQKGAQDIINSLTQFQFKKVPQISDDEIMQKIENYISGNKVLYDIQGKQNAVLSFLSLVIRSNPSQTLLLYSDENMDWLTNDREFTMKWAALMSQVIMRGNKIKIIHNINRNIDEVFMAIKQWLPLYLSGAILPFYYPKTRDGVFKRTLFIAPGTAAVASSSVATQTEKVANFLYTDKAAISALAEEFNSYLAICRPLMHIFTPKNKDDYYKTLFQFENETTNSILKSDCLSSITISYDLSEKVINRIDCENKDKLLSYQKNRIISFESSLKDVKFTEIISLPDIEKVKSGSQRVEFSDMFSNSELYYAPEEFLCHLENILRLLKSYDNYNIYISSEKEIQGFMLYAKEDIGVLVAKTGYPSVIFAINESNLTAAFWDYLRIMVSNFMKTKKKDTINILEEIIKEFR